MQSTPAAARLAVEPKLYKINVVIGVARRNLVYIGTLRTWHTERGMTILVEPFLPKRDWNEHETPLCSQGGFLLE